MASKKELIQAQSYSRRRLLTVFVSGVPGGKELEPGKPLRAVVMGTALAVLLIVGSLIFGLISPGLPNGWDNNTLLIAKDSGARYVSIKGTLYPVLNGASAQLIIPAKDFRVISVEESTISETPRGQTIGITGAPDAIPDASKLISEGWSSCVAPGSEGAQITTLSSTGSATETSDDALVVTSDSNTYLIVGGRRYAIDAETAPAVLRAIGVNTARPIEVSASWLNLFAAGTGLDALSIPAEGSPLPIPLSVGGESLTVGTVVHASTDPSEKRYVLTAYGELAELSPFGYQLYLLGTGARLGGQVEVSAGQTASFPNAESPAQPDDWPSAAVTALDASETGACATLSASSDASAKVTVAIPVDPSDLAASDPGVFVTPAHGALVRAVDTGDTNNGVVYLVDTAGIAYPIPDPSEEVLARLGFAADDVVSVPQSWVALFGTGPALTEDAAASTPATSEASE